MSACERSATRGFNSFALFRLLTDARNRHVHKVGMLMVLCGRVVGLKSLEELTENLLRDLTPSSFQVGEPRQTEGRIEIMRHRVERPAQRQGIRIPLKLELRHGQGVLCHRGALQLRHLAERTRLQGRDREEASRFLRLCPARCGPR